MLQISIKLSSSPSPRSFDSLTDPFFVMTATETIFLERAYVTVKFFILDMEKLITKDGCCELVFEDCL